MRPTVCAPTSPPRRSRSRATSSLSSQKACRTAWRHRRLPVVGQCAGKRRHPRAYPPRKIKSAARRHQRRPALYRAYGKEQAARHGLYEKNAGPARRVHDGRRGLRLLGRGQAGARPGRYDHRRHRLYRRDARPCRERRGAGLRGPAAVRGSADERDRARYPPARQQLPPSSPRSTRRSSPGPIWTATASSCRMSTTGTHKKIPEDKVFGDRSVLCYPSRRLCSSSGEAARKSAPAAVSSARLP